MKVRFVGEENQTEVFGLVFPQGDAVDVSALPEGQQTKLTNNPTFKVVATRAPKADGSESQDA